MRPSESRLQSIGATFAVHYYTALVQAPETLAALYTPSAQVSHRFQKASDTASIAALLVSTTAAGLSEVKLEEVSTTRTPAGAVKVTISGAFIRKTAAVAEQSFTQEVELRELEANTFGITSDLLTHNAAEAAAAEKMAWTDLEAEAAEAAATEATAAAAAALVPTSSGVQKEASRTSTPAPAAEATPAAAAAPVEPAKRPTSFAEALKAKQQGEGPAFSNKPVRVVAADEKHEKPAAAAAEESGKPEKKNAHKREEKALAAKKEGRAPAAAAVLYDIILKDLAASTTEAEVCALVAPVAAVKLVNIVHSEKRRRQKESEEGEKATALTFAFVQLERPADASATLVRDVVAKLSAAHADMHVEEVRERKASSGAANGGASRRSAGGQRGGRKPQDGPAGAAKPKPAAAPAKAQQ